MVVHLKYIRVMTKLKQNDAIGAFAKNAEFFFFKECKMLNLTSSNNPHMFAFLSAKQLLSRIDLTTILNS